MPISIVQTARDFGDGLLRLLYPPICWVCQQLRDELRDGICDGCAATLTFDPHSTCPLCASTIGPHIVLTHGCPSCQNQKFAFDAAIRLGPYEEPLKKTILHMKQRGGAALAEAIGTVAARSLAPRLAEHAIHLVAPVPLHWTRRWWRGFNQCEFLATALARELRASYRPDILRRVRRTPFQIHGKTKEEWRENVRGAFEVNGSSAIAGRTVLLVDDVMTTSFTMNEAARALRRAKPGRIVVVALARTPLRRSV